MEGLEKQIHEPVNYTHSELAQDYKLEVDKAETIFKYFKPYHLYTSAKDIKTAEVLDAKKELKLNEGDKDT